MRGLGIVLAGLAGVSALVGALFGALAGGSQGLPGAVLSTRAVVSRGAPANPEAVSLPRRLSDFGNPDGHFPVPVAGMAVSASRPDHVVGGGTPAGCTSGAVVRAVAEGGIIRFDCGPEPVTIVMTATADVANTERLVVLDGGGLVTLSGGGRRRILFSDACAGTWSTGDCVSQPFPQIVVQNITLEDGFDGARQVACAAGVPRCWFGGVNGGGAIYAEGGRFKAVNSRFVGNRCYG
jgi:hypothetical protein